MFCYDPMNCGTKRFVGWVIGQWIKLYNRLGTRDGHSTDIHTYLLFWTRTGATWRDIQYRQRPTESLFKSWYTGRTDKTVGLWRQTAFCCGMSQPTREMTIAWTEVTWLSTGRGKPFTCIHFVMVGRWEIRWVEWKVASLLPSLMEQMVYFERSLCVHALWCDPCGRNLSH